MWSFAQQTVSDYKAGTHNGANSRNGRGCGKERGGIGPRGHFSWLGGAARGGAACRGPCSAAWGAAGEGAEGAAGPPAGGGCSCCRRCRGRRRP